MILFYYPEVATRSFKPAYDRLRWLNHSGDFDAWCEGRTGYPLVDAGMHQLVQTGFMHNRIRMVTASFLTKHLLVDWRLGEAYFAQYLLDYELASNNGGWQWASGSGCDAAPYFRVFSPERQMQRFDPDQAYIRRWIPGFVSADSYLKPIVEHSFARNRAIAFMRNAQNSRDSGSL
jgi:deoxyribodipyrimidine photo-lyase